MKLLRRSPGRPPDALASLPRSWLQTTVQDQSVTEGVPEPVARKRGQTVRDRGGAPGSSDRRSPAQEPQDVVPSARCRETETETSTKAEEETKTKTETGTEATTETEPEAETDKGKDRSKARDTDRNLLLRLPSACHTASGLRTYFQASPSIPLLREGFLEHLLRDGRSHNWAWES